MILKSKFKNSKCRGLLSFIHVKSSKQHANFTHNYQGCFFAFMVKNNEYVTTVSTVNLCHFILAYLSPVGHTILSNFEKATLKSFQECLAFFFVSGVEKNVLPWGWSFKVQESSVATILFNLSINFVSDALKIPQEKKKYTPVRHVEIL